MLELYMDEHNRKDDWHCDNSPIHTFWRAILEDFDGGCLQRASHVKRSVCLNEAFNCTVRNLLYFLFLETLTC